jgi:hypothetical protein
MLSGLSFLAQESGGGGVVATIVWLAVVILVIAGLWKVFVKAGQPGWGCIVPIYNLYLLCKIAGRPGWFVVLYFIPIANLVVSILVALDIAKAFGKGTGFGIGLVFLGVIFFPILGFGDAQYKAPSPAR